MTDIPPSAASLRGAVDLSALVNRPQSGAPTAAASASGAPAGASVPVPSLVLTGTDANFGEILELSRRVPVVVDLGASWAEQSRDFTALLERLVRSFGGRLLLASIEAEQNPQLAQAFRAQSVPTVAALVAGQPVPLFAGIVAEDQLRPVLEQVIQLAAENGVTGVAVTDQEKDAAAAPEGEPEPAPLPPHHAEAYEAIERGDYASAIGHYQTAIAQNPADRDAVAGLAQVSLLDRLQGKTLDGIRNAVANTPDDLDAVLDVADLDLSGGHVDDAFDRLLLLFPKLDAAGKNRVRERLLELFEVVGSDDPRVAATRRRLASLLY